MDKQHKFFSAIGASLSVGVVVVLVAWVLGAPTPQALIQGCGVAMGCGLGVWLALYLVERFP